MDRKDLELMLPVGSWESLAAALQTGCDAIYFGVAGLNMRAQSSANFSLEDLAKIVETCRTHSIKTYLTLNTVVYDEDIPAMQDTIHAAKLHGIDAVIASDLSVILYARQVGVEVHASTQLNISNRQALRFFAQYCDVMVLARELNLEQVSEISRYIEKEKITGPSGKLVEIEMFCHGALCMAVSGKCYLSLHEYNRSANRGSCVQVCRRSYSALDNETGHQLAVDNPYIMSPKDLCTISFLDQMIEAGVRVFKVEGRARGPEYVKIVGQCYSEALKAYTEGNFQDVDKKQWLEKLGTVFNRGFWDGYYLGKSMGELTDAHGSKATRRKEYIALCNNYFSKIGVGEFLMQSGTLSVGDHILIIGNTTGVVEMEVQEIRVDMKPVKQTVKGEVFSMPVTQPIRRSDKIYIWKEER
ncbi:MAG: U32 family peptidase [Bacteroidales bacterium]|jgi:putative protease|nr:U32 family peptidase [Bacteroidales bacterium]